MNNKHAMYKFQIIEILILFFQKCAILPYFDPKLPFLLLKLLFHNFYLQNMDEITLRQVGPDKSKT